MQIQKYKYKIHKYTNTAYDEVPERPNMWYIFEERIVQGLQKSYPHVSNMQIQKYKYKIHKYTNTAYDKLPERPTMWDILEEAINPRISSESRIFVQGMGFPSPRRPGCRHKSADVCPEKGHCRHTW